MAKEYKDQILDTSVNEKRVYNIVDSDGNIVAENVSLEDKTVYSQEGTEFGAQEVNEIYEAIDEVNQSLNVKKYIIDSYHSNIKVNVLRNNNTVRVSFIGVFFEESSSDFVLCTLPSDCRPSVSVYKEINLRYDKNYSCALIVEADGGNVRMTMNDVDTIQPNISIWLDETFVI